MSSFPRGLVGERGNGVTTKRYKKIKAANLASCEKTK